MADNTASLVVALSAQVTRFEKDMADAGVIADKGVKNIENKFSALSTGVGKKLTDMARQFSGALGPAGGLLTALGPAGLAVGAALGTAAIAMSELTDAVDRFAEKQVKLKDGAEVIGVTVSQLKALGDAGKTAGLDFDQTENFVTQFVTRLDELRKGAGPLFDALMRINSGLVVELAGAKDSAAAIDILAKAYAGLTDASQKLALARAAGGGRGAAVGAQLLQQLGQGTGISGIPTGAFDAANAQIAALKKQIDAVRTSTADIWGSILTEETLQRELKTAQIWQSIALAVKGVAEAIHQIPENVPGAIGELGVFDTGFKLPPPSGKGDKGIVAGGASFDQRFDTTALTAAGAAMKQLSDAEAARKATLEVNLALEKRNVSALGDSATQTEQLKLKTDELAVATSKEGLSTTTAARALADFTAAQKIAAEAVRERYGVATEAEIVEGRLTQLSRDAAKYGLTENEVDQAKVIILREAKQAADALAVRQAYLPGLKQLELDAQNARKMIDTLATDSLNSFTDEMAAAVAGTKTLSQAFHDMAISIIQDLAKMLIRSQITGPLAGMIGGLFGSGGPTGTIQVGSQSFPKFAGGTSSAPGGLALVGESGPELVNLPRGSQVIPNDVTRSSIGGAASITYAPAIDARGASVEAVARLAQIMEQDRATFTSRTVATIQQARRARVAGL
jgi:lambda family phage tail tape measure protein